MCGGGLMQLLACGPQDYYLTRNPSITLWKTTYRRYTNSQSDKNYNYNDCNVSDHDNVMDKLSINSSNKLFLKELIEAKAFEEIYNMKNFHFKKEHFEIEDCDVCMECPQSVKTSCGHKYCHNCFVEMHIVRCLETCSFCRQNIGHNINVYEDDNDSDNESNDGSDIELNEENFDDEYEENIDGYDELNDHYDFN